MGKSDEMQLLSTEQYIHIYCQRNNETCTFVSVTLRREPSKDYTNLYKINSNTNTYSIDNNLSDANIYIITKKPIIPEKKFFLNLTNNSEHCVSRLSIDNLVMIT